jgi:hypothetical protein
LAGWFLSGEKGFIVPRREKMVLKGGEEGFEGGMLCSFLSFGKKRKGQIIEKEKRQSGAEQSRE